MTLINAETNSNVFIENGRGNNWKLLCIHATTLTIDQKKAIVGLHAFTGTDQNFYFFRKSKMKCWKITEDYLSTFSNLRKEFELTDDLIKELEEYVRRLYGGKTSYVKAIRNEIVWKTLKNKKRVIDLFHLPPCRSSLELLKEATILRKFGYNLIRKSRSMNVLKKMDGMRIIYWNG